MFKSAIPALTLSLTMLAGCRDPADGSWSATPATTPGEYFEHGSIGADVIPLPVLEALPDLFPNNFQPGTAAAGDWIDQFGFVRRKCAPSQVEICLPVGLTVTHHDPKSGKPSRMPYVGLTCAVCHVGQLRRPETPETSTPIPGMGNSSLDLVAFGDAVKSSVLDTETLTVASVATAYEKRHGHSLGIVDKATIWLWLRGFRKEIRDALPMVGSPLAGADLHDAKYIPSGPGRIMAARDAVRRLKEESPWPDGGPSKLPSLYQQHLREWAQFDGSVKNPLTRNSIAALGVGSTMEKLARPDMLATIQQSNTFVQTLDGPRFTNVFPDITLDPKRIQRGHDMYKAHCAECHGEPGATPSEWIPGKRKDPIPVDEIGTDPERVSVRYYNNLPDLFFEEYPADHPLKPKREELRVTHAYSAPPLISIFSRAPYLHNGSVPTLAELINLQPRRTLFYRGPEYFDATDVGIVVMSDRDSKYYYGFDTAARGNSNAGHNIPWTYGICSWDAEALKDLLEYLKTL